MRVMYLFIMPTRTKQRRKRMDDFTSIPITRRTRHKLRLLAEATDPQPTQSALVDSLVNAALKDKGIDPAPEAR